MPTEIEWEAALRDAPYWSWFPPKVILVSPHPDDETLGAGGFLAAYARRNPSAVTILAATDGEAAYPDVPDLAARRQAEQVAALHQLGLSTGNIRRLQFPDGQVHDFEDALGTELMSMLDRDTLVLAPWEHDWHPDHEACGRAAASAATVAQAPRASYFFWAWHFRPPAEILRLHPMRFELDAALMHQKEKALAEYRSQLAGELGGPILPETLLGPARRSFETFVIHAPQA